MVTNVIRLVLATLFLGLTLWVTIGSPWPVYADSKAWLWLAASALVGYVFGDFCLFNCYLSIGPRFGQLLMTLAPPMAAVAGWAILGESLSWKAGLAMAVTLAGIAISILSRGKDHHLQLTLPLKGILLGIGAGIGQGVGLVLSKVGMQHYADAVPAGAPAIIGTMMPFASTMIRAIVGAAGFILLLALQRGLGGLFIFLLALQRGLGGLRDAARNPSGMRYAVLLTIFGPVLGVSLSLMAVQYADAAIASTLMALTPVFIILPEALINKKKIKPREILGVLVSIAGVAMFFLL